LKLIKEHEKITSQMKIKQDKKLEEEKQKELKMAADNTKV